ncbi:MAG: hypothetical protein ACYC9O_11350 [Candidatus Latescibacterota bacterium]
MDRIFERKRMERIRVAFIHQCDELGIDPGYARNAEQLLEREIQRLQSQEFGGSTRGATSYEL